MDSSSSLARAGESPRGRQGVCSTGLPSAFPVFGPKDTFGSPKFPANPSCICPALRLRPGLHARLVSACRCCPRTEGRRRPRHGRTFEALSHGFCTGCLRFVPPSRVTTQNSLPGVSQPCRVGFSMPTEFVRRVSARASPLPGLLLARPSLSLYPKSTENSIRRKRTRRRRIHKPAFPARHSFSRSGGFLSMPGSVAPSRFSGSKFSCVSSRS